MISRNVRISTVGLRGVVGKGLSAEKILDFASAFAAFLPEDRSSIVIGRDPRASGVMVREGVLAALSAAGRDVIDLGIVSTPIVQHAIRRLSAAGGVSIGASHSGAEWNALKFFGALGTYLSTAEASELLDIYHLRHFKFASFDQIGKIREDPDAMDPYLSDLAAVYDFDKLRRFRVLVDCSNGTSAPILRRMNDLYGFNFMLMNERAGDFAHVPNTNAATVALQLAPLIAPSQADAGFLFDCDSDRVAMATERGQPVSEEMTLPLLADYLLPRSSAKLIITNFSTTALVEEVAARHGGRVLRVPVGRQAAMDALALHKPEEIAAAGEGTGAVMMPDFRFVYDGIASMLGVLALIEQRGEPLSRILAGYSRYSILKGSVPLKPERVPALLLDLEKEYADGSVNSLDGLRVDWPDRWFHVRVSQTEPIVRVIAEQKGDPPAGLFESLMEQVRQYA